MDNNMENGQKDISYIAFESSQARMERVNKKQWIVILVLIATLIGTNAGWIYYESQWQYVNNTTVTQNVDSAEGGNALINDGVHINGESKTDSVDN